MQITPDDMSNLFRFFRIPTPLYNKWNEYAQDNNIEMKQALTRLLKSVRNYAVPAYPSSYVDIAQDLNRVQPQIYKQHLIKQFHLTYTPNLLKEICIIQNQTGYKGQTIELNKEICARLDYALKINNKN